MTSPAIYVTRALTRDGARIESRVNLTHWARVLEARAEHGLILGGPAWQETDEWWRVRRG